jgi:redox-sensitive bicupin YhaK (pirin superfamily)
MLTLRKSHQRGHTRLDWLDSRHTFSFGDYHDPHHQGVSHLRVLNEDRVAPGSGFATHAHRDMEIISYVLEGELAHRDSLGNGSVIHPGEVQRMSAGSGIRHSEYNASASEPVHFLQIWITPAQRDLPPSYEQRGFAPAEQRGRLRLVASPDDRAGSVTVHQDACLYLTRLAAGETVSHPLADGRTGYVHLARGRATVNGVWLETGDGVTVSGDPELSLSTNGSAELLLFDLA